MRVVPFFVGRGSQNFFVAGKRNDVIVVSYFICWLWDYSIESELHRQECLCHKSTKAQPRAAVLHEKPDSQARAPAVHKLF
jgi:hypothetical protein